MGILDKFKSKKERELKSGKSDEAKTSEAKEPAKAASKSKKSFGVIPENLIGVIKAPLVTEKAAHMAHAGKYSFRVNRSATRVEVKDAVKALYGIRPESVNIQVVRGKVVRFGGKIGQRQTWKKAIVTLPKGKTIDVYEGV